MPDPLSWTDKSFAVLVPDGDLDQRFILRAACVGGMLDEVEEHLLNLGVVTEHDRLGVHHKLQGLLGDVVVHAGERDGFSHQSPEVDVNLLAALVFSPHEGLDLVDQLLEPLVRSPDDTGKFDQLGVVLKLLLDQLHERQHEQLVAHFVRDARRAAAQRGASFGMVKAFR